MASELLAATKAPAQITLNGSSAGGGNAMELLSVNAEVQMRQAFVPSTSSTASTEGQETHKRKYEEEIDIDEVEENEGDVHENDDNVDQEDVAMKVFQKEVPSAVFGSLASAISENSAPSTKAARLK